MNDYFGSGFTSLGNPRNCVQTITLYHSNFDSWKNGVTSYKNIDRVKFDKFLNDLSEAIYRYNQVTFYFNINDYLITPQHSYTSVLDLWYEKQSKKEELKTKEESELLLLLK